MDHVPVLKAADDVNDGIHLADMRKKLIAEPLPVGCALYQPGDIDKFDRRMGDLLRVVKLRKAVEPFIRKRKP